MLIWVPIIQLNLESEQAYIYEEKASLQNVCGNMLNG